MFYSAIHHRHSLVERIEGPERHYESFPYSQSSYEAESTPLMPSAEQNISPVGGKARSLVEAISRAWRSTLVLPDDLSEILSSYTHRDGSMCYSSVRFSC
jgi:hypothetical protein